MKDEGRKGIHRKDAKDAKERKAKILIPGFTTLTFCHFERSEKSY
jgi:hypothetical protein